jgi:group II intron reverse transcriptase/maturase
MDLLKEVLARDNLARAYYRVFQNKGSGGIDGMKVTDLSAYLSQNWTRIKEEILTGKYYPKQVLGVEIPKSNGGVRLLGIPTVVDRFIQQAIHQVLSQLYEPDFSEFSYGFRAGKNAHQALRQAQQYINEGRQDIIDLDLKKFFDMVNHDFLMSLLYRKVKDPMLLKLIRRFLQAGLLLGGVQQNRTQGTPQGGPLSPLLSNILLNELDKELEMRGHCYVRYADDCSIFLRSKRAAIRVRKSITRFLEQELYLKVNEEKTSICRPVHYELLGYGFVSTYRKGEKGKYNLRISPKSFKRLKLKIKRITRKTTPKTFDERITDLNSLMFGWVNYFKLGKGWAKLKAIDEWTRNRLRYCIWKQWKKPNRRMKNFIRLGVIPNMAFAWSRSRMGGWRIAGSPMMKTTVTVERLKQRGYLSFEEYYVKKVYG